MNNPKLQKQYYNVTEIAELLGISERLSKVCMEKRFPI